MVHNALNQWIRQNHWSECGQCFHATGFTPVARNYRQPNALASGLCLTNAGDFWPGPQLALSADFSIK